MRRVALAIVSTVAGLVMLLSFKSHSALTDRPAAIGAGDPGSGDPSTGEPGGVSTGSGPLGTSTPSPTSSSAGPAGASARATASSAPRTVTGDPVDTRWGPVQVRITVRDGKITNVTAVDYPNGTPRDQEINAYAIPQLNQETLSAQSAKIDTVSGATVTSDGYLSSLQSALDKAGL